MLVKQIPVGEEMTLTDNGRLRRDGVALEMNAYCRRAVSKGVELAAATGGTCTVFTLGPPTAVDVLREAIAWGADGGVHLCDPAFAGSDTLATARALAAALTLRGPFDLVLVGRNSLDGDTGQVGPEVAALCDLPFAAAVREMTLDVDRVEVRLELDDGWAEATLSLPAVLATAERLCEPCKVPPEGRAAVPASSVVTLTARELGDGPWGAAGSPTVVGTVRALTHARSCEVLEGPIPVQVETALDLLERRGALTPGVRPTVGAGELAELAARSLSAGEALAAVPIIAFLAEPGRPQVTAELAAAAARLARTTGGQTVALCPAGHDLGAGIPGLSSVVEFVGAAVAEDVAPALAGWVAAEKPWALLAPSTSFGREVAARVAASTGAGLVGDAIGLDVVDGVLVAAKPAFSGAMVADITCTSPMQMVTVRPGVLPAASFGAPDGVARHRMVLEPRGRVRPGPFHQDDDVEVLARAEVVIGVGSALAPHDYERLAPLAALLGAELGATRKVTDKGWAPRARQIGITGRSISPRLYVAIGLSGKFNHMVGVRGAGTVLAVNRDPTAPVFAQCDVGITADWQDAVAALEDGLRRRLPPKS